jgi:transcriptional regulator with XRE-family HTH domain
MLAAGDPHYIEFVTRLRTVRKSRGCTQADLAELLNKPQSYVSKVETCERRIDPVEAARWCLALGVSLRDVLPPELKGPGRRSSSKRARRAKP